MKKLILLIICILFGIHGMAQQKCKDAVHPTENRKSILNCCIKEIKPGNVVVYKLESVTYEIEAVAINYKGEYFDLQGNTEIANVIWEDQNPRMLYERIIILSFSLGLNYIFLSDWYQTMKQEKGDADGYVIPVGFSIGMGVQIEIKPKIHVGLDNNLLFSSMRYSYDCPNELFGGTSRCTHNTKTIIFTALPYITFYPKSVKKNRSPYLRAGIGFGMANFKYWSSDPTTAYDFTLNAEIGFNKFRKGRFFGLSFGFYYLNPDMNYNFSGSAAQYEDNDFNASNIYFRVSYGPNLGKRLRK